MEPTIVTAFFDIGRGSWQGPQYLKRTTEQYFERFERLLKLNNKIVVFTSRDLEDKFRSYQYNKPNLVVVGFENWKRDIWPEFFEPISKIHNDPTFQQLINQPWNPEYWSVDYVMVNMLKSYFVNYAYELGEISTDMAAWVDFGYAREETDVPTNVWNYSFDPEKIHLFTTKQHVPPFMDIIQVIMTNDVWITGCHIVASKDNWKYLLEGVYSNLKFLLNKNIIDDDQTVLYMCYCLNPDLFAIHKIEDNDWFCIFRSWNNVT